MAGAPGEYLYLSRKVKHKLFRYLKGGFYG